MLTLFAIAAVFKKESRAPEVKGSAWPDPLPFEDVYDLHFSFVWRSLRGLGVPACAIDDAAQEVFVIVHRKLDAYVPSASLRSWLFGIVRRVAKDYRRAVSRRGISVAVPEEGLVDKGASPQSQAIYSQALTHIEAFIHSLDEERQAIFVLSQVEQLPVSEIALMLNLNANTVYSRLKVLRTQLAAVMDRYNGSDGGLYE